MSKQIGYAYGNSMEDFNEGRQLVEMSAMAELDEEKTEIDKNIEELNAKHKAKEKLISQLRTKLNSISRDKRDLEEQRKSSPTDFSFSKGALFLSLSILLILGDIAILGGVLAQFLHQPYRTADKGDSFGVLIYTDPLKAFSYFPDLFTLTLSILFMGFFLKVIEDSLSKRSKEKEKQDIKQRWFYRIDLAILSLSIISVMVMAGARLTIPMGQPEHSTSGYPFKEKHTDKSGSATDTLYQPQLGPTVGDKGDWFRRIASMVLGLALPYVSAGFFLSASNKLGNYFRLLKLAFHNSFLTHRLHKFEEYCLLVKSRINYESSRKNLINSENYKQRILKKKFSEFNYGYFEGMNDALMHNQGQTVFEKLRPLAVRRTLLHENKAE